MIDFNLILVTDERLSAVRLLSLVEEACRWGLRAVQLRARNLSGRELFDLALRMKKLTAERDSVLFVNERVDVALAVGAAGVHCPERGFPVGAARKIAPMGTIGASVHSLASARRAQEDGADYVILGPIFPTESKRAARPLGLDSLQEAARELDIPVFAIGGITAERAATCRQVGARGVAVVSAMAGTENVPATLDAFRQALGRL